MFTNKTHKKNQKKMKKNLREVTTFVGRAPSGGGMGVSYTLFM